MLKLKCIIINNTKLLYFKGLEQSFLELAENEKY